MLQGDVLALVGKTTVQFLNEIIAELLEFFFGGGGKFDNNIGFGLPLDTFLYYKSLIRHWLLFNGSSITGRVINV